MADSVTDTAQVQKPINAMFTRRFLERAAYKTHYFKGSEAAEITKHGGTATGLWRRVENQTPTTTALTELGADTLPTRTASQPTVTDVTKAVAKYGDHILLNEEADVLNFNGHTVQYTDALAVQAGRSLNMVQRNEMEDNSTQVYANGGATSAVNTIIAADDLNSVLNTLDRNVAVAFEGMKEGSTSVGTVPILESFYGACHPDVAYDVSNITGFTSVEKYAGQVQTLPNEFGFYGKAGRGIRFMSSPDASVTDDVGATGGSSVRETTNSKADIYDTVIWGKCAVGSLGLGEKLPQEIMDAGKGMAPIELIHKPFGSSGVADPLNELSSIGWKAWSAAKVLNGNWIRNIQSAATSL